MDTKKKRVGNFKNGGREWQPQGQLEGVLVHDFRDKEVSKAISYGIYNLTENRGWVSVGIDHDMTRNAAEAIHRWWRKIGIEAPSRSERTADHGQRRR